jgi:glycosyltransferase involved in cell wall biosynthesis
LIGSGHSRLLKILHIDPERNWGGGEAQVLGLLTYLAERGHGIDLLTHPRGRLFEKAQTLGIRTLPLVVWNDLDLRPVPALRRLIHRERYDIVHLHTKRAHALSLWLPRGAGSPKYVVTRRMDYPERAGWYTHHLYCRRVDGVIAVSSPILSSLAEAGVMRERIRVIHSGVDAEKFKPSPAATRARHDPPVIGSMAVLEERKGHRVLLEAARLLKAQGHRAKYFLAGEGSLRKELQTLAQRLGLADDVRFFGFVSDPASFLSEIDIFALPSLYEGLGVAALEAMAAGKPVVVSRVGGLAEIVRDSDNGLLVTPGNSTELAGALAKLLNDPSLACQLVVNAAERVKSFTMTQMAQKNEAYYHELLAE